MKEYLNKKGQAALEFGMGITVFLLIVLGTIDVASIAITYCDLSYAIREGLTEATTNSVDSGQKQVKKTFDENKFIGKASIKNIHTDLLGNNNVGQPLCITTTATVPITYKQLFNDNSLVTVSKTSCSIQEKKLTN